MLHLSWAQVWEDGTEPNQASTLQVAMVTLLVSFRRRIVSFSPDHLPGLPPFSTLWEPDCPAPLPLLCATGDNVSRGSVLNHNPVSAAGVFRLEGVQEGKAPEMRPQLRRGHWGSLPLHLLLPTPPLSRPLPLQFVALTLWVGSVPAGFQFPHL